MIESEVLTWNSKVASAILAQVQGTYVASQFSAARGVQGMAWKNKWQAGLGLKHCGQAKRKTPIQTGEHDQIGDHT